MTAQDAIRQRAKELLESGEVATFIGWEAGRFHNQTTPLVITDAADADKLVFNEYCVNTLAKYARDVVARGKVGLVVRGCDSRAIVRMVIDQVIKREDVYLIGVACPGMKDRKTDELGSARALALFRERLRQVHPLLCMPRRVPVLHMPRVLC